MEAGLPSGTFTTADEALGMGREVLAVPGSIASPLSHGLNQLLYEGATPIIDDESFEAVLFDTFGTLRQEGAALANNYDGGPLLQSVLAAPLSIEELYELALRNYGDNDARSKMNEVIAEGESRHMIARQPDGRWGPVIRDGFSRTTGT